MIGKHLLLATALGALVVIVPSAAAKEAKQEKTEWEYYGDPKNEGSVAGEVFILRDKEKAWKRGGKPKLSHAANPSPFAVLRSEDAYIVYKDCFEFKIKCQAGREYLTRAVYGKKFFRKGTWEPYLLWRPVPPGYPENWRTQKLFK